MKSFEAPKTISMKIKNQVYFQSSSRIGTGSVKIIHTILGYCLFYQYCLVRKAFKNASQSPVTVTALTLQ